MSRTVIPPPPPSSALDNQCPICEKMFFQRSNLVRHLRIIHEMGSILESSQSVASVKNESVDDDSDKTNNLIEEKPSFEYAERIQSVAPDSVLHGHLVEVLPSPDIYTYKVMTYNADESSIPGSFAAMFSINLDCIEEFNEWLKLFQTKNCTQFNIIHSKKLKGCRVDFKQYLKCIHNVQRGKEGKGKHTGCLARMTITLRSSVKKYVGNGSLREDSRCVVTLSWMHNHPLLATDVLRRHTVPKEVDQKLIDLFNNGHSVKSALKCMEMELDESVGNDPGEVERKRATRSILPDTKHSYYVSQKLFKNGYDAWADYDGLESLNNETAEAVNENTECINN